MADLFRKKARSKPAKTGWGQAALFGTGVFGLGMGVAAAAFAIKGTTGLPQFYYFPGAASSVPFWLVWMINYPTMGIATWFIWRERHQADVRGALLLFGLTLVQGFTFWFSTSQATTQIIDFTGLQLCYGLAWLYSRYSKAAVWWLLPILIWMPFTFALKTGWLDWLFY